MGKTIELHVVNAFTNGLNAGSPTGVVLSADGLTEKQMLRIAGFLEVSHTAFLFKSKEHAFGIRFFTKEDEIKNCAHATIAANFLRTTNAGLTGNFTCYQETIGGPQKVEIKNDEEGLNVFFVQDEIKFKAVEQKLTDDVLTALGIAIEDVDERFPVIKASAGNYRILLPLKTQQIIQNVRPDYLKVKEISKANHIIGCFVFAMLKSGDEFESYARMFAPVIGVNEDIINGNSCGCLAAYLLQTGDSDKKELKLTVQQGQSFHRAGTVLAIAERINDKIETRLGGKAVVSWKGEFSF